MADFKARPPPIFNTTNSDYTNFSNWRQEFNIYVLATTYFAENVDLAIQQARVFNLAGQDFMKFANQRIYVKATTTVEQILDAVTNALKPTRFGLQNRGKLFSSKQSANVPAAKFLQEIRKLYAVTNYPDAVAKNTLIRDLFISGIASVEAKRLLFQQNIDTLTTDNCVLVSSFEFVHLTCSTSDSTTAVIKVSAVRQRESRPPTIAKARCHGCGQQPPQHSRKIAQLSSFFAGLVVNLVIFQRFVVKLLSNTIQEVRQF